MHDAGKNDTSGKPRGRVRDRMHCIALALRQTGVAFF